MLHTWVGGRDGDHVGGRDGDHARDPPVAPSPHADGAAAAPYDAGPARRGRLIRPWQVYRSRH